MLLKSKIIPSVVITLAVFFRLVLNYSVGFNNLIHITPQPESSPSSVSIKNSSEGFQYDVNKLKNNFYETQICELETENETEFEKLNIPVILSLFSTSFDYTFITFYSSYTAEMVNCVLFPKKHISLSILRI